MNSKQAKALDLPQLMSKMGYEPVAIKKEGRELWYRSPFRTEKDASFHTSFLGGKWIWNDFGDSGGTVIDFIMRHEGFTTISEALNFLDGQYQGRMFKQTSKQRKTASEEAPLFSFQQQGREAAQNLQIESELELIESKPISNPLIHSYLAKERCIPRILSDKYLEEIRYRNKKTGKAFFAFGMKNESDGYEIRAASDRFSFKSALKNRDITLIEGKNGQAVNIFEGMLDYLSLLAMLSSKELAGDAIIMHSTSSFQRCLDVIKEKGYDKVNCFLDNDDTGVKFTNKFKEVLGDRVVSQSEMFAPYEDLNEALKANEIPNFMSK